MPMKVDTQSDSNAEMAHEIAATLSGQFDPETNMVVVSGTVDGRYLCAILAEEPSLAFKGLLGSWLTFLDPDFPGDCLSEMYHNLLNPISDMMTHCLSCRGFDFGAPNLFGWDGNR